MTNEIRQCTYTTLDRFEIELPSWGGCRDRDSAFGTDVSDTIIEWCQARGLVPDPLIAFRESGYLEEFSSERKARREALGIAGGGNYA
ncbi:MAG: hypothetical protein ABF379_09085 [Akkermansiaceae bacterium]